MYFKRVDWDDLSKNHQFVCYGKYDDGDYEIGRIGRRPDWQRYCFFPIERTAYIPELLENITQFLKVLEELPPPKENEPWKT